MKPLTLRPYLPLPALRQPPRHSRLIVGDVPSPSCPRYYAVPSPSPPTLSVFNSHVKLLQKERAASNTTQSRASDYLRDEVAHRLCDRLLDINRTFDHVLDLGANSCNIARALANPQPPPPLDEEMESSAAAVPPNPTQKIPLSQRIKHLTCAEPSPTLLYRDQPISSSSSSSSPIPTTYTQLPSFTTLPFPPSTFSAILSSLSLHWVNDLPSLLSTINALLLPDSPFLCALFGGDSLFELRSTLQLADLERRGGVTPHISPMADVRDMGNLLTRAGFKLLTVDVDDIVVQYPDVFALITDVQAMGEGNAVESRAGAGLGGLTREVLMSASAVYEEMYGEEREGRRVVPATWRVIYVIGWKEGSGQEKPLPRGSGEVNLKDVLGGGSFDGTSGGGRAKKWWA